jgi:methionyl-tRNA formyltransferase
MRLIMMGTGPFAVPSFRGLYGTGHKIVALVTRPLPPTRGRRKPPPAPMRDVAAEQDTPIFDPEDVNAAESIDRLRRYESDLFVVCDYGQILSAETLATARLGGINIHGSLLPKYRGAAPVNWAVYHGDVETGVSLIHMTPKLDAGPVIAQDHTPIDSEETAEQLEERLSEIGARLLLQSLDAFQAGQLEEIHQDSSLASKARRLKKTDGLIDWSRSALAIKNHIRAIQPWPKAYTFWHRPDGPPVRLIVGPVSAIDAPAAEAAPGAVLEAAGGRFVVATGDGALELSSLQPAGKRMLPIGEFLRGYHVQVGNSFGRE